MSISEIRLDYADLSALGIAWRPGSDGAADPGPGADAAPSSVAGGGALAFTGRAHGSALCIDFAEFVDPGR